MAIKRTVRIVLLVTWLAMALVFTSACGAVGADVRLEGLNLGTVAMDGKPLNGLPSDKINLDLAVAAQTVKVRTSANGTILTLVPSGATIEINGETVSFKGLKPEQVKVEWAVKTAD
ncbi:MAG: hypothetical protein HY529_03275 [Chloroflexi bacterium]|nr:hypothetical protein [Chloroflexota bacterium]